MIQRFAVGMMARKSIKEAVKAAVAIQKRRRAVQAKAEVEARRKQVKQAKRMIKGCIGTWFSRLVLLKLNLERDAEQAAEVAAVKIQSAARASFAKKSVATRRQEERERQITLHSATSVQAAFRSHLAKKRVAIVRAQKLKAMGDAATVIRKMWLRYMYRRRYLELRKEFARHEDSVITLQRYIRGYVVRLRMWRNAIRAEEELWAAVEIQRCWRGYLGRLRWELEYEAVWSRESAARKIQRSVRGWLARTKVQRMRKRAARADFEKARRRFKSAQKIQALARGMLCRKKMRAFRARKVEAATDVQRIWRGHRLRCQNWERDRFKQAVRIQSASRTFLVRCRRFHLIAKVIMIQKNWRRWLRYIPEAERRRRSNRWREKREAARTIQGAVRSTR